MKKLQVVSGLALSMTLSAVGIPAGAYPVAVERAELSRPAAVQGPLRVIVQFAEPPLALFKAGIDLRSTEALDYRDRLQSLRAPRLQAIERLGGRVAGEMSTVLNAVIVEIDSSKLAQIRRIPGVKSARPAGTYKADQTAPATIGQLIGTSALNSTGITGTGVVIAVIDSGIDYTHAAFGGPATAAAYSAAVAGDGPITIGDTPGVVPNGPKVIDGFDYLGETWTGNPANPGGLVVTPDPDPIDNRQAASDFAGHGTAVASAAAGLAVPSGAIEAGSAPGAQILAYRGCSRISNACEGGALLQSVDAAVAYPVAPGIRKVINMSLGAAGGNPAVDDLSEASRNAVIAGVTVVASAGNSGNIPYITGTPSSTETLIAVAASEPPALTGPGLQFGAPLNATYALGTAAFGATLSGPLTAEIGLAGPSTATPPINLACSNPINLNPPAPASPAIPALSGKIGLSDRGVCQFAEKAFNSQAVGAVASVIANNVPGSAPSFAVGAASGLVTIPTFGLAQNDGLAIKNALAINPTLTGTFLPLTTIANPIVDQVSAFSSRGPSIDNNRLKPDITAPGTSIYLASISTGTQGAPISGTSFSSPLTAGTAALVLQRFPNFTPNQVKMALMNSAQSNVFLASASGALSPLTLSGAGRVQVDLAANLGTLAYDDTDFAKAPSLSFGYQVFATPFAQVSRTVRVQNLTGTTKTYTLSVAPRFSNDLGKGVTLTTSVPSLSVRAFQTAAFTVTATINSALLPAGGVDGGAGGNSATALTALEQDGYVTIDGGPNNKVALPYLLLPRKGSLATATRNGSLVSLSNTGVASTTANAFTLIGVDALDTAPTSPGSRVFAVDLKELGYRYTPDPDGAGTTFLSDYVELVATLYRPVTTPRQVTIQFEIDTNGDGTPDYLVFNGNSTTNQNVVFVTNVATGATTTTNLFFTAADFNSGRFVLPVYTANLGGITAATRLNIRVVADGSDDFNLGDPENVLDRAPESGFYTVTPNAPVVTPSALSTLIESGATVSLPLAINKNNRTASPSDRGVLLLYGDNPLNLESSAIQVIR